MKKRTANRAVAAALACILAVGLMGCGKKAESKLSDVEIWGAPSTEKVLRDVSGIYDSFKTDAEIDLCVARGEYEGAQIILTAQKDVTFDVTVGEIKSADGTVFPSERVEVFGEKYMEVLQNYENNGAPKGWYPDALVPFGGLKKQGENVVKAGENQGVYFRFNVPVNQAPGIYSGFAAISIGGESKTVPVRLEVTEAVVSPVSHSKSIFLTTWSHYLGELDSTQAMHDKYIEALFEYRLSPNDIVRDSDNSDEDVAYYVEKAYAFMQNPKCTNISVPYRVTQIYDAQANAYSDVAEHAVLDKYITAMAHKSFQTGYNMLKKSVTYFATFLDEPTVEQARRVQFALETYYKSLNTIADKIASENSVNGTDMTAAEFDAFKAEVVQSIRNIRNVLTSAYTASLDGYAQTFCPQVNNYHTEADRALYADEPERWWYTCITPHAPYPTYHTEDTLLSARSLGWMQAQYGVTGQLYWATDIYAKAVTVGDMHPLEDLYEGNASRFPAVNGDGYLFYPGKKYGVDGPIGSLRLEAIRDGLEEYELIYALQQKYKELGAACGRTFDCDNAISSITDRLYDGTIVSTDSARFAAARQALLNLSILSESEAHFCIADYSDNGMGTATYTLYADAAASVQHDGADIAQKTAAGNGYIYTVDVPLDQAANQAAFTVTVGDNTYTYQTDLGGKVTVFTASDLTEADFSEETVMPSVEIVDASSASVGAQGQWAKVTAPAAFDTAQSFRLSGVMADALNETVENAVLHVYYEGAGTLAFEIMAKHAKNERGYNMLASATLRPGMNTVEISLASKKWEQLGAVEELIFTLGGEKGEPEHTVYFAALAARSKR